MLQRLEKEKNDKDTNTNTDIQSLRGNLDTLRMDHDSFQTSAEREKNDIKSKIKTLEVSAIICNYKIKQKFDISYSRISQYCRYLSRLLESRSLQLTLSITTIFDSFIGRIATLSFAKEKLALVPKQVIRTVSHTLWPQIAQASATFVHPHPGHPGWAILLECPFLN